jgi:glycerol-3-phosphate dehydrogenase (NAD(P)+)
MTRVTVFGAGAMGTALAMHAARRGLDVTLWANEFDQKPFEFMRSERRHPSLPEHLPSELTVLGPDELDQAARECEVAAMGASSSGARSLAGMVKDAVKDTPFVVSMGKGLEPETDLRMSEVYGQELPDAAVIAMGGPCLASELAQGLPSAVVWGSKHEDDARKAGEPFADRHFQITYTDDVIGLEYCSVLKNVAAIGMGLLDGMGKALDEDFKNAKAALFTMAVAELSAVVVAEGGRPETAAGLAGLGDALVTSLGGRNRLYGEQVGSGSHPEETLRDLEARGMTVEGVDSARAVRRLAAKTGLDLPYHLAIHRVLFDGADPRDIMEVLL